ncbi:lauroyl acyltransferase [Roseibium salinum]|nr:lauroyl acyltransferase [Roseibium salinum]
MSADEREAIVRGMWQNLGRVAAETFHIDRLLQQDDRFEIDPDEITAQVLYEGRACVFVSFHSANWELCVQPAVREGVEITGVYQALRNPEADKALRQLRQTLYKGGLLSKSHQTARKNRQHGEKNGGRGGHDGRSAGNPGRPGAVFFGRMAYATPVPASLARTCNVPIILGRVIRKEGVKFRVEGRAISVPVTDDRQADIQAATAQMHEVFESWIREHPEQWMWIHKKWASPGKSSSIKQARRASATNAVDRES